MNENMNNNLKVAVGELSEKNVNFSERLEILKDKIVELRKVNSEYCSLQKEGIALAKDFISDFKEDKAELGKIVTWLGDVMSPEELVSIVGDSISQKDLINLNLKVQTRLSYKYKKPESFMNNHISNLVEALNTYDSYIESFESIEVSDDLNCLDRNKYLISHDLHNILLNGYRLNRDREIKKQDTGIYLVVFKMIKSQGRDVLIYKYIKYPYIFYDTLYSYIVKESSSLVITNDKSVGMDYLFVMRYFFENRDELISEVNKTSSLFKYKSYNNSSRGIYPRNLIDLCKMLLQGCPIFLDNSQICGLIKLVSERRTYDAFVKLVGLYDFYKNEQEGLNMIQNKLKKPDLEKYNLLGRLVFVTDDLDSLIKELQTLYNGEVNQGIQKWRGQSDSLSHVIDSIDTDFRKSLNCHNQYHVNTGTIPKNSLIGRSKFSYQNIHLNIGNVRWFSSKTSLNRDLQQNQSLFHDISEYIKNSPINEDTQLNIENALHDHSYINLTEKASVSNTPIINYKLINKEFSNLLLNERSKLIEYIDRVREIKFEKEPTKANDLIQYLLSSVLVKLKNDFITSVVYGRLFRIINNYLITIDNNKAVDIFVDIGSDLVSNYFYVSYRKRKKELNKKPRDPSYKLSDWRKENESIIEKYDNTVKAELGGKIISILKTLDLIEVKLIVKGLKEKVNVIIPTERVIKTLDKKSDIKPLPRRLPMIIKPKNYIRMNDNKEQLGGYLLNDEKYIDPLIILKWNFSKPTLVKDDNLVYDLVNNINSVAFKINTDVLDL